MAVQINTGGTFPASTEGQRPGLYVRFVEQALASIGVGARSKVAILKSSISGGTATVDKVYRITGTDQAKTLFGASNIKDITNIFLGGASEVVVATISALADSAALTAAFNKLETYEFHVFVTPQGASTLIENSAFSWMKDCRLNGKNFVAVFASGTTEEGNVTATITKANTFKDEYSVFVANGVIDPDGVSVPADLYSQYIAGLIAGTSLDSSLTYFDVPYAETISRFRPIEIKDLLTAGVLVTVTDGDIPRIEQGLTLGSGKFSKIRTVRAKQAMIDDIDRSVKDNYIGQITNNADGQIAVINAIKAYLRTLADGDIIDPVYAVTIDKTQASIGAEMYISISVKFLDSIEYVYLTITV